MAANAAKLKPVLGLNVVFALPAGFSLKAPHHESLKTAQVLSRDLPESRHLHETTIGTKLKFLLNLPKDRFRPRSGTPAL